MERQTEPQSEKGLMKSSRSKSFLSSWRKWGRELKRAVQFHETHLHLQQVRLLSTTSLKTLQVWLVFLLPHLSVSLLTQLCSIPLSHWRHIPLSPFPFSLPLLNNRTISTPPNQSKISICTFECVFLLPAMLFLLWEAWQTSVHPLRTSYRCA